MYSIRIYWWTTDARKACEWANVRASLVVLNIICNQLIDFETHTYEGSGFNASALYLMVMQFGQCWAELTASFGKLYAKMISENWACTLYGQC